MKLKLKTIIGPGFYVITNYFATIIHVFVNFFLRIFLPVELFGAITIVQAVQKYFDILFHPFRNTIDRDVPYLSSRNQNLRASCLIDFSLQIQFLLFVFQSLCFIVIAVFTRSELLLNLWIIFAFVGPLVGFSACFKIILKSTERFGTHNWVFAFSTLLSNIILIALSYRFIVKGYYFGTIIASCCQFVIMYYPIRMYRLIPSLKDIKRNWDFMKMISRTGLLISIIGLIDSILFSIDRFFIKNMEGLVVLGGYSLGILIMNKLFDLPKLAVGVLMPKMMKSIGSNNVDQESKLIQLLYLTIPYINIILTSILLLSLDPILNYFLPAYVEYSIIIKLVLISSTFLTYRSISNLIVIAHLKLKPIIKKYVVTVLLTVIYYCVLSITKAEILYYGLGIVLISIVTSILYKNEEIKITKKVNLKYYIILFVYIVLYCAEIIVSGYVTKVMIILLIFLCLIILRNNYMKIRHEN